MIVKILAAFGIYCFYLLFLTGFFFTDKYVEVIVKLNQSFFPFVEKEKVQKFFRVGYKFVSIPMSIAVIYAILLICVEEILNITPELSNLPLGIKVFVIPLILLFFLCGILGYHFSSKALSKDGKITEDIERRNRKLKIFSVILILTIPLWEILIVFLMYK